MSVTEAKIAVLRAVAEGAQTPAEVMAATGLSAHEVMGAAEVMAATGLSAHEVMGAAAVLRGDGEHAEPLCCLDGEPWALTEAGARLLGALPSREKRR